MICAAPITRGPNKCQPATGTTAGYSRHRYAGEPACPACLAAHNQATSASHLKANREKRQAEHKKYRLTGPQFVVCACGRRGVANRAIVGKARKVETCAECRPRPQSDLVHISTVLDQMGLGSDQ